MLKKIIDYLYQEEEMHYKESGKPQDHIFTTIKKAKRLLAQDRLSLCELQQLFGEPNLDFGRYLLFFNRRGQDECC